MVVVTIPLPFFGKRLFLQVNQSLKGKTAELRGELEGEQERVRPVREEADALRNKVRLPVLLQSVLASGK